MLIYRLVETDFIPEFLIRIAIKSFLKQKLKFEHKNTIEEELSHFMHVVDETKASPLAIETDSANEQHYELPTEFFKSVLGPNLKYSCALWNNGTNDLEQAEEDMLALYCKRAEIANGQNILDLGCGWGSLSLYMAHRFPDSQITAISNSHTQKAYIETEISKRHLNNLRVIKANVVEFDSKEKYDRIVSIEMFEHMKNYKLLFAKLKNWLNKEGKLFVHIFCHKKYTYHYDNKTDWLAKHFFSGGTMPALQLFLYFQDDLKLQNQWVLNGVHYKKTAEKWLHNMKARRKQIMPILAQTYGEKEAKKWWVYWKLFFMACAETWGYKNGSEWLVAHYLFTVID